MKKKKEEVLIQKEAVDTPVNFKLSGIRGVEISQGIVQNWMVFECDSKEVESNLRTICYFKETNEKATHIISKTKIISKK